MIQQCFSGPQMAKCLYFPHMKLYIEFRGILFIHSLGNGVGSSPPFCQGSGRVCVITRKRWKINGKSSVFIVREQLRYAEFHPLPWLLQEAFCSP